jgi:hypothetical protein
VINSRTTEPNVLGAAPPIQLKKPREFFKVYKIAKTMVCTLCVDQNSKGLRYNTNTTCFTQHLDRVHPGVQYKKFKPSESQPSIRQLSSTKKLYNKGHPRVKRLERSCANYLIKTNKPLSTFDNPAFIAMCRDFDDQFKLPCRQTLTNRIIPEMFKELKSKLDNVINFYFTIWS